MFDQIVKCIQMNFMLRTQLVGEYNLLMEVLKNEIRYDFENEKAVFLLKVVGVDMTKETLSAELNTMFTNIENNGAPWQFSQADRLHWKNEWYESG